MHKVLNPLNAHKLFLRSQKKKKTPFQYKQKEKKEIPKF